jgi:hypothetical protein
LNNWIDKERKTSPRTPPSTEEKNKEIIYSSIVQSYWNINAFPNNALRITPLA